MTLIESEYNLDSRGLIEVLAGMNNGGLLFNANGQLMNSSDDYFNYTLSNLDGKQLNALFRRSYLLRKVVTLYPRDASSAGYIIRDTNNEIVAGTNIKVMEAFKEASCMARLYGKAYSILESGEGSAKTPLRPFEEITSHKTKTVLYLKGDYYFNKRDEKYAHKSRVYPFFGHRTYLEDVEIDDDEYSDSVLSSLLIAVKDFLYSSQFARKILKNLSNLTIGMKGLGVHLKTTKGKSQVSERMVSFDMNRNLDNAIAYDLENEKIDYITQSLAQVPELLDELKLIFVSNTEYPMDKLFSQSTKSGLGSGYQNQLIVRFQWAEMVKNWSELNYLPNLNRLYQTLSGDRLEPKIEIPLPLSMTDQEIAEVEEKTANKLKTLKDSGIITADEARNSYRGDRASLNVILSDENKPITPLSGNDENANDPRSDNNENKDNPENQDAIINDMFWDAISNIDPTDLDAFAEKVIDETE